MVFDLKKPNCQLFVTCKERTRSMHIRKRNKRYQCIVKINRQTLSKTFSSYQESRAWGKIQEHTYIKGSQIFNPKSLTLQNLLERYLEEFAIHLKDKTTTNTINRIIRNYQWLVSKSFYDLTPSDFHKFKYERVKDKGNNCSKFNYRAVNKDLSIFSIVINKGIKHWLYPITNHVLAIKKFPESKGVYRKINGIEHMQMLRGANNYQKAVLLLLRNTGARPKEIFNIEWKNLDQINNTIEIPWFINKTYKTRIIPISRYLSCWLVNNLDIKTKYIIDINYQAFRFWFMRKANKLKFLNYSMYHYRRYFVQYHADRNTPLPKLALITGHKSYSILARYYGHISIRN